VAKFLKRVCIMRTLVAEKAEILSELHVFVHEVVIVENTLVLLLHRIDHVESLVERKQELGILILLFCPRFKFLESDDRIFVGVSLLNNLRGERILA